MALVTTKEMLLDAQKNGYAVGAFNVENMEMVMAVISAAEEMNAPVIMQTTPSTVKYASLDYFLANVRVAASHAKVPVVMHLDHGSSFELAMQALRTGYTSITTGILFLLAMFFSPVFIAIPSCATAPALIYVGYLMLGAVKNIEFDNITEGVPAFLTVTTMALTYSIGDGLTIGILSYVIINLIYNLLCKDKEDRTKVSAVMIVLAILFIIKSAFL